MGEAAEIINLATIAVNAALQVIGKIKSSSGMTDDQIMDAAGTENQAAKDAIAGYLAKL